MTTGRSGLPDEPLGRWFWVGLVIGGAIIAYGIRGAYSEPSVLAPPLLLNYVIRSLLAHDVVVAPVVTIGGLVLARFLPSWLRGPVRGGIAISAIVVLFSYPLLKGFGRRPGNSSTLPLDYGRNVVIVLAIIWVSAAVMAAVRFRQVHR